MRHFTILFCTLLFSNLSAQLGIIQAPFDQATQYEAVEVADNGKGWAAGTCGALATTTDGGDSWSFVDSPANLDFEAMACVPGTNCQELFLGAENYILHSTNGGNSWTTTEIESRDPDEFFFFDNDLVLHLTDEDIIWVSEDGGDSWASREIPNFPQADWTQIDQNILTSFEHNGGQALVRSSDAGMNWDTLYEHPEGFQKMAWNDAQNGLFYANNRQVFFTTNGGQDWTMGADNPFSNSRGLIGTGTSGSFHAYQFPSRLWTTTDNGVSWEDQGQYKDFGQIKDVFRNGNDIYVAVSQSAIFKSSDLGEEWTNTTPAVRPRLQGIDFMNDEVGYAIGTFSSVMRTTNGGDDWEQLQPAPLNSTFFTGYDVDAKANGDVITCWAQAPPLISTDGGDTWAEFIPQEVLTEASTSLFFHEELSTGREIYLGGNASIYTDDGGQNWNVVQHNVSFSPRMVHFYDDQLGFLGGTGPTLLHTTNGGESWEALAAPFTSGEVTAFFAFSPTHFLASRGTTAAFSTDGGQTWVTDNDFPTGYDFAMDSEGILYTGGFASGNNGDVFRSLDEGENWQQIGYVCHSIRAANLTPSGNYFFVAGDGGLIARYETDLINGTRERRIAAQRLSAFPNPTQGLLTLDLSDQEDYSAVNISLFDLNGREVLQRQEVVSQQLQLDLSQQPAGVYLVRVAGDGWLRTGRIIRQ